MISRVIFTKSVTLNCELDRNHYARKEYEVSCGCVFVVGEDIDAIIKNDNGTVDLIFPGNDVAAQVPSAWLRFE